MSRVELAVGRAMDRSVTAIRSWAPSTWLLAVGLVLWVAAQYLPAAVAVPMPGENTTGPEVVLGLGFTLLGGLLAAFSAIFLSIPEGRLEGVAGILGVVGWLANICLVTVLYLRWWGVRPQRARVGTIIGLVFAVAGIAALYLDSFFVTSVEVGSWVWLASFAVIAASMAIWRPVERSALERTEAAVAEDVRDFSIVMAIGALAPTGLGCVALLLVPAAILVAPVVAWEIAGPIGLVVAAAVLAMIGAAFVAWVKRPGKDEDDATPVDFPGSGIGHQHH